MIACNLPVHPSLTHPLTGLPLRAVGFRTDGRVIWPIIGAAEGDDDAAAQAAAAAAKEAADKAAADKAAADAAAAEAAKNKDKGFPADTPVSEMTPEQRDAYNAHMREKNREKAREWKAVTGERTPEQLKSDLAELERLRKEKMTDTEKAVDEAKATTRAEVAAQYATKLAAAEFRGALAHVPEERREQIVAAIALDKFLTTDGDVDTDKVKAHVAAIAPTDTGAGRERQDYGAGRQRGNAGARPGSVAQVMADRKAEREAKSSATT